VDAFFAVRQAQIKSALKRLGGERGAGTHRLSLELEWTPMKPDVLAGARLLATGDLEFSVNQGARKPISPIQTFLPIRFPMREEGAQQTRVDMGAYLTPAQLEAIEQDRSGGPLMLHLRLQGVAFFDAPGEIEPAALTDAFWFECAHEIKAAEWVEVLRQLGYAQGFLIQVPLYDGAVSRQAAEAARDLQQAVAAIQEGRFRDAVATCRDALEVAYGSSDKDAHPELEYKVTGITAADKAARFWLVRQALWAVTNASKHRDPTTQDIEWERKDAVAVASVLAALLEQDPPL